MIHRRRLHPLHVIILVATFGLGALLDCGPSLAQEGAGAVAAPGNKIFGVWNGTTLAGCNVSAPPGRCNAQQKVSLTVLEGEGSKVTGSYQCSYGSQDCFHQSTTGKVMEATLADDRLSIRVQTPDALTYVFAGHLSGDTVNGGYTCYNGGAPVERGSWYARRTY